MSTHIYQDLTKVTLLCAGMLFSTGSLRACSTDFEGSNLIGPMPWKNPKYDWEVNKPQGVTQKGKANTENSDAASQSLSIRSLSDDHSFSGSRTLSELFITNEYSRD